ncbi:aldehyde dehydrogenase family protein [Streptomyces sp. NPDC087420]|uniref:aldehyde dehydrogenase family protein n=1 Tax=Streptomyces sp. NPDC087420 TaxID=3365785 RepID=UPI00383612EE
MTTDAEMTTDADTTAGIAVSTAQDVDRIFQVQKASYSPARPPTLAERLDRLERVEKMLQENYTELVDALQADFGHRSRDQIVGADIFAVMSHLPHIKRHLKKWVKPRRRSSGALGLAGVRSYVVNEPLGVVGVMSPFNAPVSLALDPAVEALAAGNRVMVKPSELTPRTAGVLGRLVARYFDESELAVVSGGPDISAHFSALPWDKFVFTGGTGVGRKILAAAAPNLTPVILELGGKCPAVVLPDADIAAVGAKVAQGRLGNGGQICLCVDYALVPEASLEAFLDAVIEKTVTDFPTVQGNPEVSAIIDRRSYDRVLGYVAEAREKGFRVVQPDRYRGETLDPETRQLPLTIVVDPDDRLAVHREEVFGPVLSVYTYRTLDQALDLVNAKEKPLALYVFGRNRRAIRRVVDETSSGGVSVNELSLHAMSTSMGFGGVGPSGMGRYRGGRVGFEAFTNPKSVSVQSRLLARFSGGLLPPFTTERQRTMLYRMARLPRG